MLHFISQNITFLGQLLQLHMKATKSDWCFFDRIKYLETRMYIPEASSLFAGTSVKVFARCLVCFTRFFIGTKGRDRSCKRSIVISQSNSTRKYQKMIRFIDNRSSRTKSLQTLNTIKILFRVLNFLDLVIWQKCQRANGIMNFQSCVVLLVPLLSLSSVDSPPVKVWSRKLNIL